MMMVFGLPITGITRTVVVFLLGAFLGGRLEPGGGWMRREVYFSPDAAG